MTPEQLKDHIDLHDLALKLGLERPFSRGNYRSPHHTDKTPSVSVFKDGRAWKDHSSGQGGSCIDLVMFVEGCDAGQAIARLHELYGLPMERRDRPQAPARPETLAEYVAAQCLRDPAPALDYLVNERAIARAAAERAVACRMLGWNTWTSAKVPAGEPLHGGPAAAFVVRSLNPGHVQAVDMRYTDPALNGGLKTQTVGDKDGYPWTADPAALRAAHTVVIVESPINALSVMTAGVKGVSALALRGTGNVGGIDWAALKGAVLQGRRVLLALDYDEPDTHGRCAGQEAAWALYETLTDLGVSTLLLDQLDWPEQGWNDLNDVLKKAGPGGLAAQLREHERWVIPGLPGRLGAPMRRRVFLPAHDFATYWRFRAEADFTRMVGVKKDPETGEEIESWRDLCGFRVAAMSKVEIASAAATMTGDADTQPRTQFAVTVQTPRHGNALIRRVFPDESLHNVEQWRRLGPVFAPSTFLRMVSMLERGVNLGARRASNFVGLAWRDGKLVLNEGPDCYFSDPEKQCPYSHLVFPSGTRADASRVLHAYAATFANHAALLVLVWALGAHLKAVLGFWPHLVLQADKGAGKSTLVKRLERSIGMTMFGGQSLQTEFRILTSVSHTSHPVGWEEISARKQEIIDRAVALLQESYQYTVTRRGTEMTEYLVSAPVLLAGEDVPVRSLTQKTVRSQLTGRKGALLPADLPAFPVRGWLQWLCGLNRAQVVQTHTDIRQRLAERSCGRRDDVGAERIAGNYAAVLTAWTLLCEWLEHPPGEFETDLVAEMNSHITDSGSDREPWVWIVDTLVAEIAAGAYRYPHKISQLVDGTWCLFLRPSHVMQHLAHSMPLREFWNSLPIKTDRVLRRQMHQAGVVAIDDIEKSFDGRRHGHLVGLSIEQLARWGIHVALPDGAGEE